MKYYLGLIEINWADEIDIEQTVIMDSYDIKRLNKIVDKFGDKETCVYIGTNECIEDITIKEVCSNLSYKEISKETYNELSNTGLMSFGLPTIIEDIFDDLDFEDEDEYEEDEE